MQASRIFEPCSQRNEPIIPVLGINRIRTFNFLSTLSKNCQFGWNKSCLEGRKHRSGQRFKTLNEPLDNLAMT